MKTRATAALPGAALGLGVVVLIAALEIGDAATWLRYDREAIAAGEWWRLLSAHLVHLGPGHAVLNGGVLVLVMILVGRDLPALEWLGVGLLCALAVSLGVWWLVPEVERFVGLSGVLHGLMIAGAIQSWPRQRLVAGTILGYLAIKLTWEAIAGPTPGTSHAAGGDVLVESHLYGALPGLIHGLARARVRPRG